VFTTATYGINVPALVPHGRRRFFRPAFPSPHPSDFDVLPPSSGVTELKQ
jgi:hypothetical protein